MSNLKRRHSIKRHRWMVWLYGRAGHTVRGANCPLRQGIEVSSRRRAKKIAQDHAVKHLGNHAVWCRWSINVRPARHDATRIPFADVTMTRHEHSGAATRLLVAVSPLELVLLLADAYAAERYRRAAINPRVQGERPEAVYRSVRTWRWENHVVQTQAGYFWSHAEASAFGDVPVRLVVGGGEFRLLDALGNSIDLQTQHGEWVDRFDDDDVTLLRSAPPASWLALLPEHDPATRPDGHPSLTELGDALPRDAIELIPWTIGVMEAARLVTSR